MKTQEHRIEDLQGGRSKAQLEASMRALFRRCPALCGFTVHHMSDLFVGEVTTDPLRGPQASGELVPEIMAALFALLEEYPEACELLSERTFARVFH